MGLIHLGRFNSTVNKQTKNTGYEEVSQMLPRLFLLV